MDRQSGDAVSYFIWYRGAPQPDLLEYYETHHCRILRQLPGLKDLILRYPVAIEDPFSVVSDRTFLMVELRFESEAALQRALNSETREKARLDMGSFPPFEAEVTHLAMGEKVLFHAGR